MKTMCVTLTLLLAILFTTPAQADKSAQRNWLKKAKSLKTAKARSTFISNSAATAKDPLLFRTVAKTIIELYKYKKHSWIQGAVPKLITRLGDKNKAIQVWAVVALGELKAKQAFPAICKLANNFVNKLKREKDKKKQKTLMDQEKELVRAVAKIRNKKPVFEIIPCKLPGQNKKATPGATR